MSATRGERLDGFGSHRLSFENPTISIWSRSMVVFIDGRASCPQGSVLADDARADLELGREAQIFHVTVRLGRVQAEQGLVPWRRSYGP